MASNNSIKTIKKRPNEENSNSPKKTKTENSVEESHFLNLFIEMIFILKARMKISDAEIELSITSIIQSFKYEEGNHFSDVDLSSLGNLCGYLYRYGPHGAGLARIRIIDAITNCNDLKSILKKTELDIVSLGGGPGNDIVGLCSALYEFECKSKLNITITDSIQRFSSCVNLLEFLIREECYGNVSNLLKKASVNMSFMQLVLPDSESRKCLETLRKADIIVVSKLFSILDKKYETTVKEETIEYLHQNMKQRALLLYIDSPFYPSLWENFNILYRSESEDYSKSDITEMFGHNDHVTSKAQIVVLRKI